MDVDGLVKLSEQMIENISYWVTLTNKYKLYDFLKITFLSTCFYEKLTRFFRFSQNRIYCVAIKSIHGVFY